MEWLDSIQSAYQAVISDDNISNTIAADHFKTITTENEAPIPDAFNSKIQFYTSGSSSEPKAIVKSLEQLLLETATLEQLFGQTVSLSASLSSGAHFCATVSHHHIYGLIFRLLWPLLYKHPFNTEMILYPEELVAAYREQPNICLISSPAFLSRHDQALDNIKLTQCFSSGSLLSAASATLTRQQLGLFPTEVFGSTETGGIGYRTQESNNQVWTLFPKISIDVTETGLGTLKSPYIKHSQRLDDSIEQVDDRHFYLLGRVDRVVKIEEKRVSLGALEASLKESTLVAEAKVVVIQQNRTFVGAVIALSQEGQRYLESRSKHELNQELRAHLINIFEAVAIPRKWRYFERLPYNSEGKLPLNTLAALFLK